MKKNKFKKIIKIFGYIVVGLCVLLVAAELALRFLLPLESIKTKTLAYVSKTIGAEVKADKVSASFFGVKIENVSLDTSDNLFVCKDVLINLNPFKLLFGQLSISKIILQEPKVQIVRYKDGSFNFDALISAKNEEEQEKASEEETGVPFDIRIKVLALEKAQVSYNDLKEEIKADIKDLNLTLNNFSFYEPFNINISFNPYFEQKDLIIDGAHFALSAKSNLEKLNLEQASLNLKNLMLNYKEAIFEAKADINNFENPAVKFDMELKNLSQETLSAFTKLPAFSLPLITLKGSVDYDVQESKANIKNMILKLAGSEVSFKGNLDLNKTAVSDGKIALTSVFDNLKDITPLVEEYKPQGLVKADFNFAWPLNIAGNIDVENLGFFMDKAGTFEEINTQIKVNSIDDIKIDSLTGILNKNPFNLQASYLNKKDFSDVFFDFKADKLYVFNTAKNTTDTTETEEAEQKNTDTPQTQNKENSSSFVPINVNAKVDIKKLDVPYIKGNKLLFTAKAQNITPQLDKTHGTFNLSVQDGQIKDVYTISNANAVTKVMFMSLGIVSKVINTLNVLDLLSGMGKVLSGNKEEEEELPVHQEINGKMDFDSFDTKIDFNQGVATMEKCSFVSDLFSFRVNGNINFDNRKIKLNVDSAPGKHTEDGIMPLNIDVKGTIEDPQGSLSVISSVTALVGDTVMNNPVSNMLKSTWGKLFSSPDKEEKEMEEEILKEELSLNNQQETLSKEEK